MNKRKKTIILTLVTALVWGLAVLFGDTLFMMAFFLVLPVSVLWVSWVSKLVLDKLRKRETRYTNIVISLALLLLIPLTAFSIYDMFISDDYLAGYAGYFLSIFAIILVGIVLVAAIIVRIRWDYFSSCHN